VERDAFTAALADQRLGLIGGRDVGDRDAMAVTRQARGTCLSDPGAAAGDDGHAAAAVSTHPLLHRLCAEPGARAAVTGRRSARRVDIGWARL
jgi:hypothetical protein